MCYQRPIRKSGKHRPSPTGCHMVRPKVTSALRGKKVASGNYHASLIFTSLRCQHGECSWLCSAKHVCHTRKRWHPTLCLQVSTSRETADSPMVCETQLVSRSYASYYTQWRTEREKLSDCTGFVLAKHGQLLVNPSLNLLVLNYIALPGKRLNSSTW